MGQQAVGVVLDVVITRHRDDARAGDAQVGAEAVVFLDAVDAREGCPVQGVGGIRRNAVGAAVIGEAGRGGAEEDGSPGSTRMIAATRRRSAAGRSARPVWTMSVPYD